MSDDLTLVKLVKIVATLDELGFLLGGSEKRRVCPLSAPVAIVAIVLAELVR